jgi:hypothetical protein
MVAPSQIGWGRYHNNEGPIFGGVVKVLEAPRNASFAERVLSLTASAEGGHYDAINMYDRGLVSVGAIQFIDVGSFQVTDMLGAVADELGSLYVQNALAPAMDMCRAMFFKTPSGAWRFSLNGTTVMTKDLQKQLYFGDSAGNDLGSYNDAKRLLAKTWAACLANVWADPRAVAVQVRFTLPRLINGFVWNELKKDLFTGDQPEYGWLGALRAILLSFAVNSPATVVKRYAACRSNGHAFGTPEWCLAVLRGVIVGAGIDVWPTRWVAKRPLVKNMFGVTLPTYSQLANGTWPPPLPADDEPVPAPIPTPEPVPEPLPEPVPMPVPDPVPDPVPVPEPLPQPVPVPPPTPDPAPIVVPPFGAFATLVQLVKMMMEVIARVLGRR